MRSLLSNLLWRLLQPHLEARLKPIEDGLVKVDRDLTKSVQGLCEAQRRISLDGQADLEELQAEVRRIRQAVEKGQAWKAA